MASDREKWSNYIRSCITGTHGVNATPFCAGIQALDRPLYYIYAHNKQIYPSPPHSMIYLSVKSCIKALL